MTSHELARLLLEHPDMPVLTHANNHTTSESSQARVGLLVSGRDRQIGVLIGNFSKRLLGQSFTSEHLAEVWSGPMANHWSGKAYAGPTTPRDDDPDAESRKVSSVLAELFEGL